MQKLICVIAILFAISSVSKAQEPIWLTKIKQIEPLKSTEKDVEKIFGKPTDHFADMSEYETEVGTLTVTYSEGKCSSNKDSEYDVEKGTVVEIGLSVRKEVDFKSLNVNEVGFKKQFSFDAPGAYSFENKQLGIDYSIGNGWLNGVTIYPAENYAYLNCPQKPKQPEPIIDDVDQQFLTNLTQLKPFQNDRIDVAALLGKPAKSENDQLDFYVSQKFAVTFLYSTGRCTFENDDKWNVSKGKITEYAIGFYLKGITISLDLSKLTKKEDKRGFSIYEDEAEGIEYQIKNNRIWEISYSPAKKYDELKCKTK